MNLTEINGGAIESEDDLYKAALAGSFLGTLQAGYTDFHYLRPIWKTTTEEDALIGVGITGIGAGKIEESWLVQAAQVVVAKNADVADWIEINKAARTTTVKPSGTSSLVVGSPSGVHAAHAEYWIRRIRYGKDEAIWQYLSKVIPELCEDEKFRPQTQGVLSIPQKAGEGAFIRTESPLTLLERVKAYNVNWVGEGHNYGDNHNNVSCTISLKDDEWDSVGAWMWDNRGSYNGISVLPYSDSTYVQMPFEDCTKEYYDEMVKLVRDIDLTKVEEHTNNTDLAGEIACGADGCEIV